MQSHGQAALVYHSLHQLHVLEQSDGGRLAGLTLALSAVNLGEAAATHISPGILAEIYLMAALRAKMTFGSFGVIESYFIGKGRQVLKKSGATVSPSFSWIFQPIGQKYWQKLRSFSWDLRVSSYFPFCTVCDRASPMDYVSAGFKQFLITRLLEALLNCGKNKNRTLRGEKSLNGRRLVDIMEWSHLLLEASRPWDGYSVLKKEIVMPSSGDELCTWWTNLLTCAVHWATGDNLEAQDKYQSVRSVPQELLTENLALCLGHAFCAQKLCLENKNQKKYEHWVWMHCCKAKQALVQLDRTRLGTAVESMEKYVQLIVFDWLSWSLTEVWKERLPVGAQYWLYPCVGPLNELYQNVLAEFRRMLYKDSSLMHNKGLLHEVTGRMLSGANPVTTWQMLHKCSRIAKDGDSLSEQDHKRLQGLLNLHQRLLSSQELQAFGYARK